MKKRETQITIFKTNPIGELEPHRSHINADFTKEEYLVNLTRFANVLSFKEVSLTSDFSEFGKMGVEYVIIENNDEVIKLYQFNEKKLHILRDAN